MLNTKKIGYKIADARKKINISQAQLAEKLFISSQAVGKWERGESMPDILTLNRLAKILGVDLNYFSEDKESVDTEIIQSDFSEHESIAGISTRSIQSSPEKQKKMLHWDMSRGNWVDADFSGLKNLHEKFGSSNMQRCKFIGSDLSGLLLKNNNIAGCDFSTSNMRDSQIQRSNLVNNQFKNCSLQGVEFSGSFVSGCDFNEADCTGLVIKSGGIEKSILTNAVLNRVSFIDSYLGDIVFEGIIDDCYFENCAFKRVVFQNATLLNSFFKNKSLKGVRFVDCQADRMTYEFLKNGKADLAGIILL